ncbi:hypothetical protein XENOCAPTIV_014937 [Xenoophorus captivus]|uniref:Uncharacterized protein n=1 Tax=Xenoophorus captivus TaxID=1517983 RepID=A0ABV0RUA1_9TELE
MLSTVVKCAGADVTLWRVCQSALSVSRAKGDSGGFSDLCGGGLDWWIRSVSHLSLFFFFYSSQTFLVEENFFKLEGILSWGLWYKNELNFQLFYSQFFGFSFLSYQIFQLVIYF